MIISERIWNILVEGFYKIMLASVRVTIPLTILGFSFAMVIAMFMALVQYAKVPVLRQLSRIYIWIFRGTPLLVQLFLAYYGLPKIGLVLNSFVCAVIVFSLNEGAYCAETMRSALEAVPEGQMEAGYCVGMSYWQIMRRIILPQAFRTAFPSLSNSFIAMIKSTSMASTITVSEMIRQTQIINGRVYQSLALYLEVGFIYLMFCTVLTWLQSYGEKKLNAYGGAK